MTDQLSAKQLVRFPYCRIYRRFLNSIVENPAIRKQGQALLFRYAALFSLANFRPALRTVDGVRYAMQAGEWVATYRELCERLHLHTHKQARTLLHQLEAMNLIEMQEVTHRKLVRFKIRCWHKTNTTLSYSAPCPKDTGFFFFPVAQIPDLIGAGRCSESGYAAGSLDEYGVPGRRRSWLCAWPGGLFPQGRRPAAGQLRRAGGALGCLQSNGASRAEKV